MCLWVNRFSITPYLEFVMNMLWLSNKKKTLRSTLAVCLRLRPCQKMNLLYSFTLLAMLVGFSNIPLCYQLWPDDTITSVLFHCQDIVFFFCSWISFFWPPFFVGQICLVPSSSLFCLNPFLSAASLVPLNWNWNSERRVSISVQSVWIKALHNFCFKLFYYCPSLSLTFHACCVSWSSWRCSFINVL